MATVAWHMPANMRGRQLPRPPLHCTRAMTRVRLSLTSNCLLRMHRITWELLLGMVCTPGMTGTAVHARDDRYRCARTCHATALSHCVHPEAAPTHTVPVVVGGSDLECATCKDIRSGIRVSALVRRGLHQPSHGLHGRPCETAQHRRPRWVADLRNPTARDHLWHPAVGSVYTSAPLAVVHLIMPLRSSHLIGDHHLDSGATAVGDHLFYFGATAVASASACRLCQERVFPSCPDFGSAPRAHGGREHRWHHIEHLLFECPGILGPGGPLAVKLLRDDLCRAYSGSDHTTAMLLATFPCDGTPLWLPRLVSSRSSSTLLLHWDVPPPLAHEAAMSGSCRGVLAWCVVCGVHAAASV